MEEVEQLEDFLDLCLEDQVACGVEERLEVFVFLEAGPVVARDGRLELFLRLGRHEHVYEGGRHARVEAGQDLSLCDEAAEGLVCRGGGLERAASEGDLVEHVEALLADASFEHALHALAVAVQVDHRLPVEHGCDEPAAGLEDALLLLRVPHTLHFERAGFAGLQVLEAEDQLLVFQVDSWVSGDNRAGCAGPAGRPAAAG